MVAAMRHIESPERDATDVLAGVRSIGELLPHVLARYRLPVPEGGREGDFDADVRCGRIANARLTKAEARASG